MTVGGEGASGEPTSLLELEEAILSEVLGHRYFFGHYKM